jgi:hypothetical protein
MGFVLDMIPYIFHAKFLKWTVSFSAHLHWSASLSYSSCYYIPTFSLPLHYFFSFSKYFCFSIYSLISFQDLLHVTFFSQLLLILNNYFSVFSLKFLWGFLGYIFIHTQPLTTHAFLFQIFRFFAILIIIVSVLHYPPPKHGTHLFHLSAPLISIKFQICFQS